MPRGPPGRRGRGWLAARLPRPGSTADAMVAYTLGWLHERRGDATLAAAAGTAAGATFRPTTASPSVSRRSPS